MSAHCDRCGHDLPYAFGTGHVGNCGYCAARDRVAELEGVLRRIELMLDSSRGGEPFVRGQVIEAVQSALVAAAVVSTEPTP